MASVLSPDEIDQLLTAINAANAEPKDVTSKTRKIRIYNFKRPDKFFKEQIRTLSIIHENFARLTTYSLSAQLRYKAQVHVASVDQLTYEEFIRTVPTPTTMAIINMDSLNGNVIMEIDPAVSFTIIDRICGGSGYGSKYRHELTDIEQSIMESIVDRMLDNMREAWAMVSDLRPRLNQINTDPQFTWIVPLNELVILVSMDAKIGDVEGMINICIPYLSIKPIIDKLSNCFGYSKKQNITSLTSWTDLKYREEVPVSLSAEILRRDFSIKEIWEWDIGTIISPLFSINPDYCYLSLGDRRIWHCQILPDCKSFPKRIAIVNYAEKPFGTEGNDMKMEKGNSLVADALSSAAMKITVELGAAIKTVKQVFAMGEGTIVELDKLAGEPVDVKANGVLIAYGEVVVIDESFGVRITKIIGTPCAPEQSGPQQSAPEPSAPTTGEST